MIETVPNGNALKQFKVCLVMIAKIYDSSFPMVVFGSESQNGIWSISICYIEGRYPFYSFKTLVTDVCFCILYEFRGCA